MNLTRIQDPLMQKIIGLVKMYQSGGGVSFAASLFYRGKQEPWYVLGSFRTGKENIPH